jgi:hypothetical protein
MNGRTVTHYCITAKLGQGRHGRSAPQSSAARSLSRFCRRFAADAGRITKSNPLARVVVAKPSSDSRTHSGRFSRRRAGISDGSTARSARGCPRVGSKSAPLTWGRQKIFGVRKFCGARIFFAARFFLGADPDCQRGFGRESEPPHPVALVSLAPWAQVLIRHPNWLLRSVDARG